MEDDSDVLSCCSLYDRKSYVLPENFVNNIDIEVLGTYKSGLKKFTRYRVHGADQFGQFEVVRRFKEFRKLREVLCSNWLGCIVPLLPGKKMFGNFDKDFIQKRKQMLGVFLSKVSKVGYLYLDDFFQYFIRNEENFLVICKDFCPPGYRTLAKKYKNAFLDLDDRKLSEQRTKEIQDLCKSNLLVLKNWSKSLKNCEKTQEVFNLCHKKIFSHIQKIVFHLIPEKHTQAEDINHKTSPFASLRLKLKVMINDLKSLEESIIKYSSLNKLIQNFQSQAADYLSMIEEIRLGKRPILTTRSKEDQISDLEKIHSEVKKSLNYLTSIVEKVYINLCVYFKEIESVHYNFLCSGLKEYAATSISNYERIVADALGLECRLLL